MGGPGELRALRFKKESRLSGRSVTGWRISLRSLWEELREKGEILQNWKKLFGE